MATKAVARITADWTKLSSKLTTQEVAKLNKLKSKIDATTAKLAVLPEKLPTIDWAHYKTHASDPKLVAEIEKRYNSLKLERPKAPAARLAEIDRAKKLDEDRYKKFLTVANSYIESAEVVKEKFEKMIPIQDMTHEDWALTFPEWSTSIENPSIAPHWGRTPGLTREEAAAFDQPDPLPFATKTAWKEWEEKKKKFYS